ncbi:NB-ARC domain-containing protein [Nostoc sp. UHCC 0870]|uniref:NB-ARC domain-containing protein n=1 Tax=Nostoc sp. UHCC 0870 TaxID=2914041 RepID=UPI001EDDFA52|nr:NB-ARC domain-containing protein [Nostoc sp. UHCC 0870]UKP01094.1 NB-ARC domain-containing protein [Nostoc sp. UHCC 0870]
MDFQEAIAYLDQLVFVKQGRWLEQPEKIVLESAWLDQSYEDVVKNGVYDINLLQRRVAPKLWLLLTGILGNGEKVTKKRLRGIVEKEILSFKSQKLEPISNNAPVSLPVLKGVLPEIPNFYGRTPEMSMLKESLAQERCVVLTGVAGVGKSALAAKLVEAILLGSFEFNKIIWKSISYGPLLPELVGDLIKSMNDSSESDIPESTQARVSMLFSQIQNSRCLVVLDSAESILQGNREIDLNQYGKKYEEYGGLFKRLVEEKHMSCFLIITREPFIDISRLYRKGEAARTIKLEGLGKEAWQIFRNYRLKNKEKWGDLIATYRGNPLSLNVLAQKIKNFFGHSVDEFLKFNTVLIADILEDDLDELFKDNGRLTSLEKQILLFIAEEIRSSSSHGFTFNQLAIKIKDKYHNVTSTSSILDALEALVERSLIEEKVNDNSEMVFGLQPLVIKYIINYYSKKSLKCA